MHRAAVARREPLRLGSRVSGEAGLATATAREGDTMATPRAGSDRSQEGEEGRGEGKQPWREFCKMDRERMHESRCILGGVDSDGERVIAGSQQRSCHGGEIGLTGCHASNITKQNSLRGVEDTDFAT